MLKHLKFKQSYRETDTTPKILTNAQRDRHNPKDTERQTQPKDTERQTKTQRY